MKYRAHRKRIPTSKWRNTKKKKKKKKTQERRDNQTWCPGFFFSFGFRASVALKQLKHKWMKRYHWLIHNWNWLSKKAKTKFTVWRASECVFWCSVIRLSPYPSSCIVVFLWTNGSPSRHGGLWGPSGKWHQSCWRDSQHGTWSGQCLPQLQDPSQAWHTT